jgi:GH24 family phage-related lysozyme (muramidase)
MKYLSFTVLNDILEYCKVTPKHQEHAEYFAGAGKVNKRYISKVFNFAVKEGLVEPVYNCGVKLYLTKEGL